jgi:hypothetical protein
MLKRENIIRNTVARVALQPPPHWSSDMKIKTASWVLMSLLAAACGRQQTNSDGNGPGNADGAGGREDSATAPATEPAPPASEKE